MGQAGQPAGTLSPVIEKVQRERSRRCVLEKPRVQNLNAGEDDGGNLALGPAARQIVGFEKLVAASGIADRPFGRLHHQERVHPRRVPRLGQARQGGRGAVDPN